MKPPMRDGSIERLQSNEVPTQSNFAHAKLHPHARARRCALSTTGVKHEMGDFIPMAITVDRRALVAVQPATVRKLTSDDYFVDCLARRYYTRSGTIH